MKTKLTQLALTAFLLSTLNSQLSSVLAQGTAITYQGRLTDLSSIATGIYDFTVQLFDAATGGASQGGPLSTNGVSVTDGFFTVTLDFGAGPFSSGASRWLEIGVRTNTGGAFDFLSTRQALTAAPYAIAAGTVTGPVASSSLSGNYSNAVNFANGANSFSGSFAGDGAGLTNLNPAVLSGLASSNAWQLGGNHGTNSSWYLGTADYQPLELRVNGYRGLRLQPASNNWPNLVAGASNNVIFGDVTAASIGGGVNNSIRNTSGSAAIGGGRNNVIQLNSAASVIGGGQWNLMGDGSVRSVISGGYSNVIRGFTSTNAAGIARDITDGTSNTLLLGGRPPGSATIGGGYLNTIGVDSTGAVIAGGERNTLGDDCLASVIAGGHENLIQLGAYLSVIGGGDQNVIQTNAFYSTIAGGFANWIQPGAYLSVIGGGELNRSSPNAGWSTIGGGTLNIALGRYGTIPGGYENMAAGNAFAAGHRAKAVTDGSFVWADNTEADFVSTEINQFLIRAAGGVGINKNNPATALDVNGTVSITGGRLGIGTTSPSRELEMQNSGDVEIGIKSTDANGHLWTLQSSAVNGSGDRDAAFQIIDRTFGASRLLIATNGDVGIGTSSPLNKLHVNGGITCVALTQTSDRHAKEHFAPVSPREVLDKVTAMPITTWNCKGFRDGRHMGPMAQDFYAAFGLGGGDTTITSIDPDGVALAAIQGLNLKLEERSKKLEAENAALKSRLERLERLLADSIRK